MTATTWATERAATLHVDGWAGRRDLPVVVIGETEKRYRIRASAGMALPGRWLAEGQTALVPKLAVTFPATLPGDAELPGGRMVLTERAMARLAEGAA